MESPTSNNSINAIKDVRKLFNELRSNLSFEETNRTREKLYKREAACNSLKEKEEKGSLTNKEKKVLKNIDRYLKNISTHLKNFKKYLKKLEKYQYGLDYLFNKYNKEDYITEPLTLNNDINPIKDVRKLFNKRRSNHLRKETNEIRKKLYKKEAVYNFLKEKEQKVRLTNKQKKVLKNIDRYLKSFKKDLEKLQKYQYNTIYGLDYFFNEEDYYEPREVKSVFDGICMLYESRGDKDSKLAMYEYFDIIRPYLKDMIDDHKARGEWKIQLIMQIIFVSFIDSNETRVMHTKSDNTTIMSGIETDDAINEFFNTFRRRYQEGLETRMRGSGFVFERIDLLEYHLHKISLNRGSSYIKYPEWIKNKEVTTNLKNTNNHKCFQYAIIAALNHQNISHHPERISKLGPFINICNWKDRVSITFKRLEKF